MASSYSRRLGAGSTLGLPAASARDTLRVVAVTARPGTVANQSSYTISYSSTPMGAEVGFMELARVGETAQL